MSDRPRASVEDVVIDILSRNDQVLPATDLFVLATRAVREHGAAGERTASMPAALHSLDTFTDYLRTLMASTIRLSGCNNDCEVHLKRAAPRGLAEPWAELGAVIAPHGAHRATNSPDVSAESSSHWYGDFESGGAAVEPSGGGHAAQVYAREADLPAERLAAVRQRVCDVLVSHVLHESEAHSSVTSLALAELRRRCMACLVQGFHNMPRELVYEDVLEAFIESSGCAALVRAPGQPTLAFKPLGGAPSPPRTPSPQPLLPAAMHPDVRRTHSHPPLDAQCWPSPALDRGPSAPHRSPPPLPAPMRTPMPYGGAMSPQVPHEPAPRGPYYGHAPGRSAQHSPAPPPYMPHHTQPPPRFASMGMHHPSMHMMPANVSPPPLGPGQPFAGDKLLHGGPHSAAPLEAAVVALLRSRNAYDGPKSQAVEAVRAQLLQTPEVAGNTALASLAAFQSFLLHLPCVQVWTSKTSDIVRCLLKREAVPAAQWPRMRDGAFAPALAPYSTPEDIEAFAVMAGLPTLYKAVHVFLASRKAPCTDSKTAVPVHALLRALRSPRCAGAQWATHPGLRSAPILLRFLKDDTALAIGTHEGEKLDTTPLHLNKYHNSYRAALKAFEGSNHNSASLDDSARCTPMQTPSATPSNTPSRSPSASSPAADSHLYDPYATHAGGVASLPAPVFVASGYPSVGEAVQLWGPTANTHVLSHFLDVHGAARCWGVDYKVGALPGMPPLPEAEEARAGSRGRLLLLSIACCDACLVWDVAAGGVPRRLRHFLEDAAVQKCRVSAGALVATLLRSLCINAAGVVDLRQLQTEAYPDQPEVAAGTLADMVQSVLGVRVAASAALDQSDWAARPLSSTQTHYTLQSAWLHAHLMQRLGTAIGWRRDALEKCTAAK